MKYAMSICALLLASQAFAQDQIVWSTDYGAAVQAAKDKNLPIIIDVVTDNCVWCVRMDQTTYRDRRLVGLVFRRFIPLKVHSSKYPKLIEALRIEGYPTTILATPDGRIIEMQNGYQAADILYPKLLNVAPK